MDEQKDELDGILPSGFGQALKGLSNKMQNEQIRKQMKLKGMMVTYTFHSKADGEIEVATTSINPELALEELLKWRKKVKKL